jgi:hypothetical protein
MTALQNLNVSACQVVKRRLIQRHTNVILTVQSLIVQILHILLKCDEQNSVQEQGVCV